jgi:hypothetical protein
MEEIKIGSRVSEEIKRRVEKEFNSDSVQEPTETPKKELKMVGQIRPQRGHTLFKYTVATGRLVPMVNQNKTFEKQHRRVVLAEEGCLYVSALNYKNAIKKIVAQFGLTVTKD